MKQRRTTKLGMTNKIADILETSYDKVVKDIRNPLKLLHSFFDVSFLRQ